MLGNQPRVSTRKSAPTRRALRHSFLAAHAEWFRQFAQPANQQVAGAFDERAVIRTPVVEIAEWFSARGSVIGDAPFGEH
jgi:hypothetical protein